MATKYVDSAATGLNDGTSWTDAWTGLASSTSVAAGDKILIDDGHSETTAANTTLNWTNSTVANPVQIICVDKADDSLSSGAIFELTSGTSYDLLIRGCIFCYGVVFKTSDDLRIGMEDNTQTFENCTFQRNAGAASASEFDLGEASSEQCLLRFVDCTFDCNNSVAYAGLFRLFGGTYTLINCTFSNVPASKYLFDQVATESQNAEVMGCDLSAFIGVLNANAGSFGRIKVTRCKIAGTFAAASGATGLDCVVYFEQCDDGTISAPAFSMEQQSLYGKVSATLARYRTGGADDGGQANAYAWEMVSNTSCVEMINSVEAPSIVRWVDAGASQTVKIYIAGGATLNDDDFWIEVSSPNETADPNQTAQGNFQSTRMAVQGTPAALTTDSSSTWNGTGVGTKQEVSVTISPTEAGPVTVRCFLAKPSTTVYVDPKIEVT